MLLALQSAALAAISMMLGLMRWPSVHWHLAELQSTATAEQQPVIAAVFDGLNTYLGNYIGEFLGEASFNMFFLLSSWTLLRARATPVPVAVFGLAVAGAGFVGMFRNVTHVVAPVAAVNNYLLPLWMIVFGVVLLRHRAQDVQAAAA
jgi:drug/metabolite transporter (DMT)-like permease